MKVSGLTVDNSHGDRVPDWSGTDRIGRTLRDVTTYSGSQVQRVRT